MNTGIIHGESNADYHGTDAVSHSKLNDFRRLPLYYYQKHVAKTLERDPPSKAMLIGTALHSYLLEGDAAFRKLFSVIPADAPKRPTKAQFVAKKPSVDTIAAIEYWTALESNADQSGRELITIEDAHLVHSMLNAVAENDAAAELLTDPLAMPEVVFRRQMKHFTVQCRTDAVKIDPASRSYIVDVKTCGSLCAGDRGAFEKNLVSFGYHRQAAFYREVFCETLGITDHPDFYFIAVEKEAPFQCVVYQLDDTALAIAEREIITDLKHLRDCYDKNEWPGAPKGIQTLSLPAWYVGKAIEATQEIFT